MKKTKLRKCAKQAVAAATLQATKITILLSILAKSVRIEITSITPRENHLVHNEIRKILSALKQLRRAHSKEEAVAEKQKVIPP